MDAEDYTYARVCKLGDPSVEKRARMVRRMVLFAFIIALADFVVARTGYALPSAHELWSHVVSLGQAIVNIPA